MKRHPSAQEPGRAGDGSPSRGEDPAASARVFPEAESSPERSGLRQHPAVARLRIRPWVWDLLALAALTALAWVAFGFLLRDDLGIYGDHPGQFMRFWYPVRVSHQLLGWNPLWYAGYPELQFYLPGYVLLGWALDALTLGQLSAFGVYQLLLFLAGLLPGVSVYALVRQVTQLRWTGFVTGSLALIFPVMWGELEAVWVGMVGWRLAFGLMPLAMLAGWRALHSPRPTRDWLLAALALAATALMHPFHAVAPAVFLALCAAGRARRGVLRNWAALIAAGMLALGLIAFWLVPLVARAEYAAPMLRATLDQTRAWLTDPTVLLYLGVAALAPLRLLAHRDRAMSTFAGALAGTAGLLVGFIFLDHLVLIRHFHVGATGGGRRADPVHLILAPPGRSTHHLKEHDTLLCRARHNRRHLFALESSGTLSMGGIGAGLPAAW
jgi:hypothetical protein